MLIESDESTSWRTFAVVCFTVALMQLMLLWLPPESTAESASKALPLKAENSTRLRLELALQDQQTEQKAEEVAWQALRDRLQSSISTDLQKTSTKTRSSLASKPIAQPQKALAQPTPTVMPVQYWYYVVPQACSSRNCQLRSRR